VARQALMQSRRGWLPGIVGLEDASILAARAGVALGGPGGGRPRPSCPPLLGGPEGGLAGSGEQVGQGRVGLGEWGLRSGTGAGAAGVLLTALRSGLVNPGEAV